jgi:uncharacterized membrane protein YedE/YeeE
MLAIFGLYSALRFVVYPSYEARYYGVFFLSTALAAVMLIRGGLAEAWWKRKVPV